MTQVRINPQSVKTARKELGQHVTQEVLGSMLHRACGRGNMMLVSQMERGKLSPKYALVWARTLAQVLHKPKEYFLTEESEVKDENESRGKTEDSRPVC